MNNPLYHILSTVVDKNQSGIPPEAVRLSDHALLGKAITGTFKNPVLRKTAVRSIFSIFCNFFFLQHRAAFLPGRIPVASADHPLDEGIPFTPKWGAVYLDFVGFWVRVLGFLFLQYRRRANKQAEDFIRSMGELYAFAAEVYREHLSTTRRPRYYARPRFALIHLADPHLMCIPSLHVMVVVRTYTYFRRIVRSLGDEERFTPHIEELRRGALAITEAILYVKQHSVNCIPAALYAMTCFDASLFPPEEAVDFVSRLFTPPRSPPEKDAIRDHILTLYRRFLAEGASAKSWKEPLLRFLDSLPVKQEGTRRVRRP
jgi:hypothetical protein